MKSVLVGLATVIVALWLAASVITLFGLMYGAGHPGEGLTFQPFTWVLIAPALAIGAGFVLLILWSIGEKVRDN